jgi:hypothetical protein
LVKQDPNFVPPDPSWSYLVNLVKRIPIFVPLTPAVHILVDLVKQEPNVVPPDPVFKKGRRWKKKKTKKKTRAFLDVVATSSHLVTNT